MDDFNAAPMMEEKEKSFSESSDEEETKKEEAATGEADLGTDITTSKKEE
jgi:hypothetical protein